MLEIKTLDTGARIRESGAYRMSADAYHGDPCPDASLSQSIAKLLIDCSPRHAWHAHPRLNPDFQPDDETKFDLGTAAHRLLIGQGRDIIVLPFDDWRKTAAKDAREAARLADKTAILQHQADRASEMIEAAREQMCDAGFPQAFRQGDGEVCVTNCEQDIWLRALVDWMESATLLDDYKTTERSVAPHVLEQLADQAGWNIQAAMHERILDAIDPANAGRRAFRFFAQEAFPPYAMTVGVLSKDCLTIGRKKLDHAVNIWRRCLAAGKWPLYRPAVVPINTPEFAEKRWLDREVKRSENDYTLTEAG